MSVFSIPVHADNVLLAQELLTKLGYTPGPIDGSYGAKTKYALDNYYAAKNKKFDGELSANALPSIFEIGLAKKLEQLDAIMVLLNDARQRGR